MTNFWFGDIAVGLVVDKDTDISKDVTEKNFVDEPVQVYELTPNLEAGSYSVFVLEETHPRSETLSEQRDAVLSMPERHVSEFPFAVASDEGHVLVEESNLSITPSEMVDEGEIGIRFMSSDNFRPAYILQAESEDGDFSVSPEESVIPVANAAGDVYDESTGNTVSPETPTITTEDGQVNLYKYDSSRNVYSYDRSTSLYGESERVGPVRTYDAGDERIYSSLHQVTSGSYMNNGRVEAVFNDSSVTLNEYDGTTWNKFGDVDTFTYEPAYLSDIGNISSTVTFRNDVDVTMKKALPFVRFDFSGKTSFEFSPDESFTVDSTSNKSVVFTDGTSGRTMALVRNKNDGSLNTTSTTVSWDSLDTSTEYTAFIVLNANTFEDYVFALGNRKRSLVEK